MPVGSYLLLGTGPGAGSFLVIGSGASVPPLAAGTVSFVSSGPAGIDVSATDATGGTSPYTYQWQRNQDGGAFSNLTGATSRTLSDTTATTPGVLYGYKLIYTDADSNAVTSNTVTAQVYDGGAMSGGSSPPATPSLSIADNGDGTGAVAAISATGGAAASVYVAPVSGATGNLSFTLGGIRTGDGTVPLALSPGSYLAYAETSAGSLVSPPSNFPKFNATGPGGTGGSGGTGGAIAPSGHQGIIHAGVAWLLASSPAWQNYLGVLSADDALAHVPLEADDTAESGSTRPRIIVHQVQFKLGKVSLTDFRPGGEVWVSFELPVDASIAAETNRELRLRDEKIAFYNTVDAILADCTALQGTGAGVASGLSHVSIADIVLLDGPTAIEETREEGQHGEAAQYFYGATYCFYWQN